MTKPLLDGNRARNIAKQLDEEAAEMQVCLAELIDAHFLRDDRLFTRTSKQARTAVMSMREAFRELMIGNYQAAELLLGMNIPDE